MVFCECFSLFVCMLCFWYCLLFPCLNTVFAADVTAVAAFACFCCWLNLCYVSFFTCVRCAFLLFVFLFWDDAFSCLFFCRWTLGCKLRCCYFYLCCFGDYFFLLFIVYLSVIPFVVIGNVCIQLFPPLFLMIFSLSPFSSSSPLLPTPNPPSSLSPPFSNHFFLPLFFPRTTQTPTDTLLRTLKPAYILPGYPGWREGPVYHEEF